MTNPAILRAVIRLSGLSVADFGTHRMGGRPNQTLYAWLTGQNPIPDRIARWLQEQPEYPDALRLSQGVPESGDSLAGTLATPQP